MTVTAERPTTRAMKPAPRHSYQNQLTLAAVPTAVVCARLLVRYQLQEWRISQQLVSTAERIAEILVTQAVATTGITELHPTFSKAYDHLTLLVIRLRLLAQSIVIEVWDSSPEPPTPFPSMAGVRSNYYPRRTGGKVVWCELDISRQSLLDDTIELPPPLPRRKPNIGPPHPIERMNDPAILRQVLEGLQALDDQGQEG